MTQHHAQNLPGMQPDDLFRIRWLADTQISPNGAQVAFTHTLLDETEDDYRAQIWLAGTDGSGATPLTNGPRRDGAPRWSPDGAWLAFTSRRGDDEKEQLYVLPTRGGEARALSKHTGGVAAPAWSPDGKSVCVVGKVSLTEEPAPVSNNSKKAPRPRVFTTLKYKLNAEGFIYDRRKHLYIAGLDGGFRQLTDGDFSDDEPAWSPDGRRIVFVSARHENRDFDRVSDLFTVDVVSGAIEQLTDGTMTVASPAWSPDGLSIAFLGYRGPDDGPRHSRLWLIEPGGTARCLSESLDLNLNTGLPPVWAPDGRSILVGAHDRGAVPLLRIDATSGTVTRLIEGERTIASYSTSDDGRIAFVASTPAEPAEVFLAEADGTGERRLTGLNDEWAAQRRLASAERLTADGPGGPVDAWLVRPADYRPGQAHPLLVNIHGGPFMQQGWAFHDEYQVQAGAGFGVIYCNYRGSSGHGEAFARSIVGEPAIKEAEDVLATLDHALATLPDIDRGRLGVLGGSYGGYLTSWLIGHTDRFAAACSERAINNRLSKAGTDDINTSWAYFRTEPWRDPQLFLRLSPLMYAEQMTTPLLILHSEEDLRCPMEQAEQLFTALKRLRRDVTFVRFPGENHELTRNGKPSHRVERFEILLAFFTDRMQIASSAREAEAAAAGGAD
ncbi:MAG TPA: S9 family peptidase [Dehalococcoidia bacterium]|nr:S9 family peptidase [Dehalococcoidia bacterium]